MILRKCNCVALHFRLRFRRSAVLLHVYHAKKPLPYSILLELQIEHVFVLWMDCHGMLNRPYELLHEAFASAERKWVLLVQRSKEAEAVHHPVMVSTGTTFCLVFFFVFVFLGYLPYCSEFRIIIDQNTCSNYLELL